MLPQRVPLSFLGILVTSLPLAAQDSWTQVNPTTTPPPRSGFAMAYDSDRAVVVLFGGRTPSGTKFDDTWEWNGKDWAQVNTPNRPQARYSHSMAYDANRKRMVVFSGRGQGDYDDTWEFDGKTWQFVTQSTNGYRLESAMAYDATRKQIVRFGGIQGPETSDTFTWDGKDWTLATRGGPPARYAHGMAWDSIRERIVMFGGIANSNVRDDTWEWDGNTWTERKPKTLPSKSRSFGIAFHAGIGRTVVYGGRFDNETWSWDGNDWLQHSPTGDPGAQNSAGMGYDAARDRLVLLTNSRSSSIPAQTWVYHAPVKSLAVTRSFGAGCAGKTGTPKLDFVLPPYIGAPVSLELTSLPASTFAIPFLYISGSNKAWGSVPLPWNLAPLGAPNCQLLVRPDLLLTLQNVGGSATLRAKAPGNPSLVGQTFYAQGFVIDGTANALGAAISNGVEGRIGQRW